MTTISATYGDTTTGIANFNEIVDIVTAIAFDLELEYAVMSNLVNRHEIPHGQDRVRIMYQTGQFVSQDYTDGDEISVVQQMAIDTLDLTCNQMHITYRVSDRALRQSSQNLAALCGDEQAKAQAEALEVRCLSLFDDAGTVALGSSGAASDLRYVRKARRLLRNVARIDGGPAPLPIFGVIDPIQEEDLLADLGVAQESTGGTNTVRRVIPGFLEKLIEVSPAMEGSYFGQLIRIPFFVSGYIGDTIGSITTPSMGAVFSKQELLLGVAADWETKPFETVEWPGIIVRAMTDYGTRVGPFPKHVIQFDTAV